MPASIHSQQGQQDQQFKKSHGIGQYPTEFLQMLAQIQKPAQIDVLHHELLEQHNISLHIKRDDLIHPVISGNKLFKLTEHIRQFFEGDYQTLITFGGAYSNHIHACAYAAKLLNIPFVAIIRGEQILPLNPTLQDCVNWGCTLEPVARSDYKIKLESPQIKNIVSRYDKPYVIPEGGSGSLGILGASALLDHVALHHYDYVVCACGTGTTLAGLILAAQKQNACVDNQTHWTQVIGVPVLKNATWMYEEVNNGLKSVDFESLAGKKQWQLWLDYHFGGYGKQPKSLLDFMEKVHIEYGAQLDPIYTAKAFYAVLDQINNGTFKAGSRVLFVHTGGLQGNREP